MEPSLPYGHVPNAQFRPTGEATAIDMPLGLVHNGIWARVGKPGIAERSLLF
jgi:hypothetical protein